MAISWNEAAHGSSSEKGGVTSGAEIPYKGSGTGSVADAEVALALAAPATLNGRILDYVHADEIGGGRWEGFAKYKSAETGGSVGAVLFSFNTSGGTKHYTQSKGTKGYGITPESVPENLYGTIGGLSDGTPAGVEVVFPQFEFQLTVYRSADATGDAYVAEVAYLTGKVNSKPFRGFQAGEVLFLGAQGAKRSGGDWEISLKFAASPNRTNVKFGTDSTGTTYLILVPTIGGWEYPDVHYTKWDSPQHVTIDKPSAVYIHKIYDEADLTPLLV